MAGVNLFDTIPTTTHPSDESGNGRVDPPLLPSAAEPFPMRVDTVLASVLVLWPVVPAHHTWEDPEFTEWAYVEQPLRSTNRRDLCRMSVICTTSPALLLYFRNLPRNSGARCTTFHTKAKTRCSPHALACLRFLSDQIDHKSRSCTGRNTGLQGTTALGSPGRSS